MGALGLLLYVHFLIYLWQMQSLPSLSFSASGDHYIERCRQLFCLQVFHPECGWLVWTGSDSSLCEHPRPRTKAAEGWLTVLISSHRTAPGGFQTELEEGKESSMKEKDFRTRVWCTSHWKWSNGTSTQHSPWWGLVVHSAAMKCPTLPSFEPFLVRGLSILLQFVSSCLLLFSDISALLLGCSVQKLKNYMAETVI